MDNDDYESLNEDFKIVDSRVKGSHFFTSNEMFKDATIPKVDISYDEMIGDPSRGKSIKNSRPAVYDIHTASSSSNGPRNIQPKKAPRPQEKEHVSWDEMANDPSREKVVKQTRPEVNYRICPICSEPMTASCNCNNHDSICGNNHKWHVKDGKIMLGHTH